jgi:hypothetical protein
LQFAPKPPTLIPEVLMKKVAAALAVLALGCGGSSGSGGVSIDQFANQLAQALCAQNFKCCDASELTGKTMADCVSTNGLLLGVLTSSISSSQSMGRASYSAPEAGACITAIRGLTCDDWKKGVPVNNQPTCADFITPKVASGGACQQDFECVGGGTCVGADSGSNGNPPMDGVCTPADPEAAVGESCATASCASGSYCDPATSTCKVQKGAGETCDPNGFANECANTCDVNTSKCTCYASCAVAGPFTPRGTLLSLALLGLTLFTARLRRGPSKGPRTPPR